MDNKRIIRLFKWIFLATIFQGLLYIISNLAGINIFSVVTKEGVEQFQRVVLLQNPFAVPKYNTIFFVIGFLTVLTTENKKHHLLWIIPAMVTLVSFFRNQIIVSIISLVFILFLVSIYLKEINIFKIVKILVLSFILVSFFAIIFSNHAGRLIEKFGLEHGRTIQVASYLEKGTFLLRLNLIEESFGRTLANNSIILGNGYIREAKKGQYDFVVGEDTLIAPAIYTEGIIGLMLRIIPLLVLLGISLKFLLRKGYLSRYFAIIIIVLIVPEIANIVQTKMFMKYNEVVFISYLLILYSINQIKEQKILELKKNE